MSRQDWRRPLVTFAAGVVVAFIALGWYLLHRQEISDTRQQQANARAERYRAALCDILSNIPGQVPANIAKDRDTFAPPGHPAQCRAHPGVTVSPAPVHVFINGHPATIVVVPEPQPSTQPQPSPTSRPTPKPRPSHTPTPSPSPSPVGTCITVPLHHDVCIS